MQTGLDRRTVFIAGASRNMGRGAALAFAEEGARLVLCTSQRTEALQEVAEEARAKGAQVIAELCDITRRSEVEAIFARATEAFGSVDVVVNLAGSRLERPTLEITDEEWDRNIAVNLTGAFNTCRAAIPGMAERGWGRIINIAGVTPFLGGPTAKAMVKLGVVGLTRGLAKEFGEQGITANCVGPGAIARDSDAAGMRKPLPGHMPIARYGRYSEIASLMVFLASEDAGYVTGQCWLANGGAYFL